MQQKTHRPAQFEITEQTRLAVVAWVHQAKLRNEDFLFPSRLARSEHISTRQYARIVKAWGTAIGLDPALCGTHTLRRTKASLIYRRTKNPTATPSPSAIRWEPRAHAWHSAPYDNWNAAAGAMRWSACASASAKASPALSNDSIEPQNTSEQSP